VLRQDSRAAGIAADVAASISPYTDQLAHDPKLRRRLADAIRASVIAGARARRHTGTAGLMWALASDPVLKRHVSEAIVSIQDAKRRIDRRRNRRTRVIIGLVGLGAIAALAVPVVRRLTNEAAGDAIGTTAGAEAV
jgi:hypothetical protein